MDGAFHRLHGPSLLAQEPSRWILFLLLPMLPLWHILSFLSWLCFARPSLLLLPRCYQNPPIHSLSCFWSPNSRRSSAHPQLCFRPTSFPSPDSTHRSCSLIPNLPPVPQLRLTLRPSVLRGTGSSLPWPRASCRRRNCPLQARRRLEPSSLCLQDPESHSTCSCSSGGQGFPPGATPTCLHPLP